MKISIICFSLTGENTGEVLAKGLTELGYEAVLYKKSKYLEDSISTSLQEWTREHFINDEGIIFISATGIAVRSIAPNIVSKKTDPAVLVVDECGTYVISLLSGHLGGANQLTKETAQIIKAVPIVTTATDLHKRFAVDEFAKKNHCSIFNMKAAKEVSAGILAGDKIGFYSEFSYEGTLPKGLIPCDVTGESLDLPGFIPEVGVAVTIHKNCIPFQSTTVIVPKAVTIGIGCRKGKEEEFIYSSAKKSLEEKDIFLEAIEAVASIDIKKEEQGILSLCNKWNLPFLTFTSEELLNVAGDFTCSSFVKQITGVDNVCERSCVLASENGKIIQNKIGENGVTTAMALRDWRISFE